MSNVLFTGLNPQKSQNRRNRNIATQEQQKNKTPTMFTIVHYFWIFLVHRLQLNFLDGFAWNMAFFVSSVSFVGQLASFGPRLAILAAISKMKASFSA